MVSGENPLTEETDGLSLSQAVLHIYQETAQAAGGSHGSSVRGVPPQSKLV